jgi:hypothetical protein
MCEVQKKEFDMKMHHGKLTVLALAALLQGAAMGMGESFKPITTTEQLVAAFRAMAGVPQSAQPPTGLSTETPTTMSFNDIFGGYLQFKKDLEKDRMYAAFCCKVLNFKVQSIAQEVADGNSLASLQKRPLRSNELQTCLNRQQATLLEPILSALERMPELSPEEKQHVQQLELLVKDHKNDRLVVTIVRKGKERLFSLQQALSQVQSKIHPRDRLADVIKEIQGDAERIIQRYNAIEQNVIQPQDTRRLATAQQQISEAAPQPFFDVKKTLDAAIYPYQKEGLHFSDNPKMRYNESYSNLSLLRGVPVVGHYDSKGYVFRPRLITITSNFERAAEQMPEAVQQIVKSGRFNRKDFYYIVWGASNNAAESNWNLVFHPVVGDWKGNSGTIASFNETIQMGVFNAQNVSGATSGSAPFGTMGSVTVNPHPSDGFLFACSPNNARFTMSPSAQVGLMWVVVHNGSNLMVVCAVILNDPFAREVISGVHGTADVQRLIAECSRLGTRLSPADKQPWEAAITTLKNLYAVPMAQRPTFGAAAPSGFGLTPSGPAALARLGVRHHHLPIEEGGAKPGRTGTPPLPTVPAPLPPVDALKDLEGQLQSLVLLRGEGQNVDAQMQQVQAEIDFLRGGADRRAAAIEGGAATSLSAPEEMGGAEQPASEERVELDQRVSANILDLRGITGGAKEKLKALMSRAQKDGFYAKELNAIFTQGTEKQRKDFAGALSLLSNTDLLRGGTDIQLSPNDQKRLGTINVILDALFQ